MKQRYRLVAYANNGDPIGSLSHPTSYQFGIPYNDVSGFNLSYSDKMPNAARLFSPCEVGVEYSLDGDTWTEVVNGRFLRIKRGRELVGPSAARTYTMPGYAHLLKKAKQLQITGLNSDGKRVIDGNVGVIMKTLIDENKAAGGSLVGMSYDFTATLDSAGQPWAKQITDMGFEPGIDLYTILYSLADQGMVDWFFQGRTLRIFNLAYLDVTKPVTLRPGIDLKGFPLEGDLDEMVHTALVQGDQGIKLNVNSPYSPPVYWGKWQAYITASGVTDEPTMTLLANQQLADGSREKAQLTAELQVRKTLWEPFAHFQPGNYVSAPKEITPGGDPAIDKYRVRQINVDRGSDGELKVDLVINDRFAENEIKRARKILALSGGATQGGTGTIPTLPPSGVRTPATPTNLVAEAIGYSNVAGFYLNTITVNWADVTTDVKGIGLIVDSYDVQAFKDGAAEPTNWGRVAQSRHQEFDMAPGVTWAVRVRAISSTGNPSAWTDPLVLVTTETDSTPPAVPSVPVLTSVLGTATVNWDGRAAEGAAMPPDLDFVKVWQVGVDTYIDRIERGGGYTTIGGLEPGVEYSFQLSAIDMSGNESERTAATAITVVSAATDAGLQAELDAIATDLADDVATQVQYSADGISKIIYSPYVATGTAPVGSTWYQRNTAQEIIGQWEYVEGISHPDWYLDDYDYQPPAEGGSGWVSKTLSSLILSNLDAGKITFGEMDGLRIRAGTIRANALSVGLQSNLIVDPGLLDTALRATRSENGWIYDANSRAMSNATQPTARVSWATGGSTDSYARLIQVVPGERYLCTAVVYSSVANTVQFQFQGYDSVGAPMSSLSSTPLVSTAAGVESTLGQVFTIPAGMFFINVGVAFTTAVANTRWVKQVGFVKQVPAVVIEDGAITAAKIAVGAVTANSIAAGSIDGMLITGPTVRTAATGTRVQVDSQGIRLYSGSNLKAWMATAFGQLRAYGGTDLTHTSTTHGLQVGDDDGGNLAIDNNEIMARSAGSYAQLLINREGGSVLIGGLKGGFDETSAVRTYPKDANHLISLRGQVLISNTGDGGYADERPPFMIGGTSTQHLWMDANEIGSGTGDGVGRLFLQPPREAPNAAGDIHHTELVVVGSNSLAFQRYGDYNAGTRSTFIFGYDSDLGLRFSDSLDAVLVVSRDAQTYKTVRAAAFTVISEQASKKNIGELTGALDTVRKAPSRRWKYRNSVESKDRWHVGPMAEDLPDIVRFPATVEGGVPHPGGTDIASMLGMLWAAVGELADRVERLTSGPE